MSELGFASPVFLACLALPSAAQGPVTRAVAEDSSTRLAFEGFVLGPGGTPEGGAVVVSSAGGRALTDRNGRYRLALEVPRDAKCVQITATSGGGSNLLASRRVETPASSRHANVELLQLSPGSSCEPSWLPAFGGQPGTNTFVFALAAFDDGSGLALYAAGRFTTAGGVGANRVAKWDGTSWSALGSGINSDVNALAVYDDGGGPALYAAGGFAIAGGVQVGSIAKWDGTSWSALGDGLNLTVLALAVYDDGRGPALYAGGRFTSAGGSPANRIARWDGASWSALGSGLSGGLSGTEIGALAVYDDGSGPALYAGGSFAMAGSVAVKNIARWEGTEWTALSSGVSNVVHALTVYDDGSGPDLFAGGIFASAGGQAALRVAKWDGLVWTGLGAGVGESSNFASVDALAVYDDGSGSALYAAGRFLLAGGMPASRIARWDGSCWASLSSGVTEGFAGSASALALAVFDDGSSSVLCVGGDFTYAGETPAIRIALWNGSSWKGPGPGLNGEVRALAVHKAAQEVALHAGGILTGADGVVLNGIAKREGPAWENLGPGLVDVGRSEYINALARFDDGGGAELYAGGDFHLEIAGNRVKPAIAKWDGSSWSTPGSGMPNNIVNTLAVYDDGSGPGLFAGGNFTTAGGIGANRIAKWDGTIWSVLGSGLAGSSGVHVDSLAVYDDGTGPSLYVGGSFTTAGGLVANSIARWDGTGWSPLGSGMSAFATVSALTVFDDGSGPALFAGGNFTTAGGLGASRVAKWDGTIWSEVGGGVNDSVLALIAFHDAGGPVLCAGGRFRTAGGLAVNRIAAGTARAGHRSGAG